MEQQVAAAYATLGLAAEPGAPLPSDRDVKEAYRRLVLQHHPDRAPQHARPAAEAAFVRVRQAYETLLKTSAGYGPPPPGNPPSAAHAAAWWHARAGPDGRVPWGQYNGYETEMAFYRAMVRSGRSSLLWLSAAGLLGVPVITALSMAAQSLRGDGGRGGGRGSGSMHRRRDADGEARGWGMTAGGLRAMMEEEEGRVAAGARGGEAAGGARGGASAAAAAAAAAADANAAEEEQEEEARGGGGMGLDSLRAGHRVNGGTAINSPFAATTALDRHALLERLRRQREERDKGEGGKGDGGGGA